jgi:hypothetical protein
MGSFGISYDRSMIIDRTGIVQYSSDGVNLSAIQAKIDELLATTIKNEKSSLFSFDLYSNYPNPFNPITTIRFSLDVKQKINLNIFDAQGRLIRRLIEAEENPGFHSVQWNGKNQKGLPAASGVYFYQLQGDKNKVVKKMQLLR